MDKEKNEAYTHMDMVLVMDDRIGDGQEKIQAMELM